jgi:hypothetical protein
MAAAVAVCSMACFAGALGGPYIFDDTFLIANNPAVHSFAHALDWFQGDFWNLDLAAAQLSDRLHYFRPLVLASYALDWQLGGGAPFVFHLTNLLLQGSVAVLAFFCLWRWVGWRLPALIGALVFALHPTKAESVAWIAGRPDLLLTLGVLVATSGIARRLSGKRGGLALELAGTLIAYLSKESAVVLPGFAFIEGWIALGRPALGARTLWAASPPAQPQLAVAALYLGVRHWYLPLRTFEVTSLSVPVHGALWLETLGRSLVLTLWPARLSMLQALVRTTPSGPVPAPGYVAAGVLLLGLLVLGAVFGRVRRPAWVLCGALGFGLLLPVSNLIWSGLPSLVSPRFLYLPEWALAWGSAELFLEALRRGWWRGAWLASVGTVFAFGTRAALRANEFTSETRFWNRELHDNPEQVLGLSYAVDYAEARARPREALALAAHGFAASASCCSHDPERSAFVLHAVQLASALTPDLAQADLRALERFLDALGSPSGAHLLWQKLELGVAPGSRLERAILRHRPQLLLLQADLCNRLGDDARALELAQRALDGCARCSAEWHSAARIALRAGDLNLARHWLAGPRAPAGSDVPQSSRGRVDAVAALDAQIGQLDGPARIQREAERDLLLDLPGRAYARLAPHRDAILAAGPEAAQSFAEVATRAGDRTGARAALADLPEATALALIAAWEQRMRWQDAAPGPTEDATFEATLRELLDSDAQP